MSQHWHNLTKGALRIEKVSISVPGKFKKCLVRKNSVHFEEGEPADIQVIPSGVLTSTQYGPCGTRGKTIQLPLSNLSKNETDDDEDSSTNLLLRTWINSNYGVFLESLHPDDVWHSNESTTVSSQNFQKMLY